MKKDSAQDLVEHLFRHESGHIISRLSSRYGMVYLTEIEDAVSEALIRALKTWSIKDIPDSPAAWLYTVASRILIDVLRQKQLYYKKVTPHYRLQTIQPNEQEDEFATLKLMLWCAHPDLSTQDQLGLILQLVSGFSVKEIGSALLIKPEVMKKRLQRARNKIKNIESELTLPEITEVKDRYPTLRAAIYLGFNEGYYSVSHDNIFREDLIFEALRLNHLLCSTPHHDIGISYALLSLMLYHTSRIPARRTSDNSLILLEDQDRSKWDQTMMRIANEYMEMAMNSPYYTPYHIEAVIAGVHTQTKDYKDTNWNIISDLYGKLYEIKASPLISLNYCFALLKAGKVHRSKSILSSLEAKSFGIHQYLFYAVQSNLAQVFKDTQNQKSLLWKALDTAPNEATRHVLKHRLMQIDSTNL
ncbi:MAG: sigma-70 family RNA polymerase sigma factor [Saprospiraceae bacterium]|nr:sigma-70 family RNA polymerase sigma factor [Saprospiraceae bacterium]